MGIFTKHNPEKSIAVVSIESGAVRLGLSLVTERRAPVFVYQTVESFPMQEKVSLDTLEANVFEALGKVCERAVREGFAHIASRALRGGRVDELHFVFSSPWHISQTKTITITNDKPFVVTEKIIRDAIQHETDTMLSTASVSDISIIEERITNMALNGYNVTDPYGKKTGQVALTVFVSGISKTFREKIEETLERFIHPHAVYYHSSPLIFFSGIRDMLAVGKDFLALFVGEEITDATYAHGETLRDTASFPMGRASYIRALSTKLKCLPQEAVSYLDTHHVEALSAEKKKEVRSALDSLSGEWAGHVRQTLAQLSPSGNMPRTVFVCVGENPDPFVYALSRGDWFGRSDMTAPFETVLLSGKTCAPFVKSSGNVRIPDGSLVLATLYAQKMTFAKDTGKA